MIHNREDYNQIQDPSGKIGEDEPVFLLRGQDKFTPELIRHWAILYMRSQSKLSKDVNMTYNSVLAWANRVEIWQEEHGCKVPDIPVDQLLTQMKDLTRNF